MRKMPKYQRKMAKLSPKEEIVTHIPALRAFAISLTHSLPRADDLVQDTLVKGWSHLDRFEADTNMRAWLFTILRNTFYSDLRKSNREVSIEDMPQEDDIGIAPEHDGRLAMNDFRRAFARLPIEQREALALVTIIGVSYEEAADTCNVAIGTIKSRINRGRASLTKLLGAPVT